MLNVFLSDCEKVIPKKSIFASMCMCKLMNENYSPFFSAENLLCASLTNDINKKYSKDENNSDDVMHFCPNILSFCPFQDGKR